MTRAALQKTLFLVLLVVQLGARADTLTLKDGTEVEGIILEQSASTVTVQLPNGASRIFRKADVEVMQIDKNRPKAAPVPAPKAVEVKPPVPSPLPPPAAAAGGDPQPNPPPAPALPKNSALRPTSTLKSGEKGAGGTSCFVQVQPGQQPIFLCCLHLFGTATGLPKDIPSADLISQVQIVRVEAFGESRVLGEAAGSVIKTGYSWQTGIGGDVAAFTVRNNAGVNVLKLAAKDPEPGEWVWLVGDENDHSPQQQRLFPIRVLDKRKTDAGFTDFVFRPTRQIKTSGFSGAPIINAQMEVVAVFGGRLGIHPDGTYDALWGATASCVREHLERSKK